jgi:hypothetical protein
MGQVILKMLPFALGSIAPTMIDLLVILSNRRERSSPIARLHPWQVCLLRFLGLHSS